MEAVIYVIIAVIVTISKIFELTELHKKGQRRQDTSFGDNIYESFWEMILRSNKIKKQFIRENGIRWCSCVKRMDREDWVKKTYERRRVGWTNYRKNIN